MNKDTNRVRQKHKVEIQKSWLISISTRQRGVLSKQKSHPPKDHEGLMKNKIYLGSSFTNQNPLKKHTFAKV